MSLKDLELQLVYNARVKSGDMALTRGRLVQWLAWADPDKQPDSLQINDGDVVIYDDLLGVWCVFEPKKQRTKKKAADESAAAQPKEIY